MPKAGKASMGASRTRAAQAAKGRARVAAPKARGGSRMQLDTSQGGWATNLVFDVREPKLAVSLRLDADVLRFFRGFGAGYQTRINEVLKAFMHARMGGENGATTIPASRLPRPAGNHGNGKRAR